MKISRSIIWTIVGAITVGTTALIYLDPNRRPIEPSDSIIITPPPIDNLSYFLDSLKPENVDLALLARDSVDDFWWEFFNCRKVDEMERLWEESVSIGPKILTDNKLSINAPAVGEMLKYPLKLDNGWLVQETFPTTKAKENKGVRIGKAVCTNNNPRII